MLSATNFLNALYVLECNDWNLTEFDESNIDVRPDEAGRDMIVFATVIESLFFSGRDDTEQIIWNFISIVIRANNQ